VIWCPDEVDPHVRDLGIVSSRMSPEEADCRLRSIASAMAEGQRGLILHLLGSDEAARLRTIRPFTRPA
jgi:hypothetical protein